QPAIAVGRLVGVVLVKAGVHARPASGLFGVLWRNGRGESRATRARRWRRLRGLGRRVGTNAAVGLAEVLPRHALGLSATLGGAILCAALLHGQGLAGDGSKRSDGGEG